MVAVEEAGYFEVPGAHLYTVLHQAPDPLVRVLLVGPFAAERHTAYIPWVRWARFLAARGIECLRYDYRGIGESTGALEEMTFDHWIEDVQLLAEWLRARQPRVPLLLNGLEIGAILAAKAFEAGLGDALLLWAAPANANAAIRSVIVRRVAVEYAFKFGDERKSPAEYIRGIEGGQPLDLEGYRLPSRFWRDSFHVELPAGLAGESGSCLPSTRPIRMVELDGRAAPLVKGSSVDDEALARDQSPLFEENFQWIARALRMPNGGSHEPLH